METLPVPLERTDELKRTLIPAIEKGLTGTRQNRAKSAYLTICLGENERLRSERAQDWEKALQALQGYPELLKMIFTAPEHTGEKISARAAEEGLKQP